MKKTHLVFVFLVFGVSIFFISCTGNIGGQAVEKSVPACPNSEGTFCGDGMCNGCETCEECYADCCPNKCYDSDGGDNSIVAGTLTGIYKGKVVKYDDYCMNINNLMEYYCADPDMKIPTNKRIDCSLTKMSCRDGACV